MEVQQQEQLQQQQLQAEPLGRRSAARIYSSIHNKQKALRVRFSNFLSTRYQRLEFEFATASKKITFATGSAEDLGIYHIYGLIAFRTI